MYEYSCKLERVIDGDTLDVAIDLGLRITSHQRIRLNGLNAPERNTTAGKTAIAWVLAWFEMRKGRPFIISTTKDKQEKYGRYLGEIWCDGESLNMDLVEAGHAVKWDGNGSKPT